MQFLSLHRLFGAILISLISVFMLWACIADIDIVAVAQGKLVPESYIKVSQPAESGIVSEILVKDGDHVNKGQTLLKFDDISSASDEAQQNTLIQQLSLQVHRLEAHLSRSSFTFKSGDEKLDLISMSEYLAKEAELAVATREAEDALSKAESMEQSARAKKSMILEGLPIVSEQALIYKGLEKNGAVSHTEVQDKVSAEISKKGELNQASHDLEAAISAKNGAKSALLKIKSQFIKSMSEELTKAQADLTKAIQEQNKRSHKSDILEIKAPTAGVVTGMGSLVEGKVVAAGAPLLSIVPTDDSLIAEGWLRNEDAPYVVPSLPVKVKLSAYPFQKYGWLEGEVIWIGADSETPESMKNQSGEPLFYKVRVKLLQSELIRDGVSFKAKPGMQVSSDIQIGKRTLMEYLTSPLKKIVLEAARER